MPKQSTSLGGWDNGNPSSPGRRLTSEVTASQVAGLLLLGARGGAGPGLSPRCCGAGSPGRSWAGGRVAPPLPSSRGLLPVPVFKDMSHIELGTAPLHHELALTNHICRGPTSNEATSSGTGLRAPACCFLGTQFNLFTSVINQRPLPRVLRDVHLKWLLNERGSGFLVRLVASLLLVPCELCRSRPSRDLTFPCRGAAASSSEAQPSGAATSLSSSWLAQRFRYQRSGACGRRLCVDVAVPCPSGER